MRKIKNLAAAILCVLLFTCCSIYRSDAESPEPSSAKTQAQTQETSAVLTTVPETEPQISEITAASTVAQTSRESEGPELQPSQPEEALDEHGVYDSADEVCEFLLTYRRLPDNFMTKREARQYGWEGGALHLVVPGMCIGGDRYGNYEGLLPEDEQYHECDIGTLDSNSRGACRLVYSDDFDIYYTEDHYQSFTLIGSAGEE